MIPRKRLKVRELIQRDIDDQRVRDEIVTYLRPSEGVSRPRFFPPIVVAVFPVGPSRDEPIATLYPAAVRPNGRFPRAVDADDQLKYEVWEYGDAFRVRIPLPDPRPDQRPEEVELRRDAIFHGAEFGWNRERIHLVAIDGQHRLLGLKAVFGILNEDERARGYNRLQGNLVGTPDPSLSHVPICLVFAPELYERHPTVGGMDLLKVFRQVFVDINKNARVVSASRNILLNERDAIAIFTRNMVDSFLSEADLPTDAPCGPDQVPLYAFEIESPEKREDQITDIRALSSVGVLNTLIDQLLLRGEGDTDHFRTALRVDEGDPDLTRDDLAGPGVPMTDLDHEHFSLWQRDVLEQRFRETWQPAVMTLLRGLFPADQLIQTLEVERIRLAGEKAREPDNPDPDLAYDFLIGTDGDRRQIEYASRLDETVGRFNPGACARATRSIKLFLADTISPIRSSAFARILFSNVGQRQIIEFALRTLWTCEPIDTPASLARAWVADFNAVFAPAAGHQKLFDRNETWNDPVISSLGTQSVKQRHIGGLLMVSAAALPANGQLSAQFASATQWGQVQQELFQRGVRAIRSTLEERLRRQISQRADLRAIGNAKNRTRAVNDELLRQMREVLTALRGLLIEWGGSVAQLAQTIDPVGGGE